MQSMRFLVPVTDCTDVAINELRASVHSHYTGDQVLSIEPNVAVVPYSITNADFLIRLVAESYVERSIIFCMANFGQARPRRILGRTEKKDLVFQGADSGAFTWLIDEFGCAELVEIFDPGFRPFGGKYVHAPVLGQVASGVDIGELGTPIDPASLLRHEAADGTLLHVDNFGNGKIKMTIDDLEPGSKVRLLGPGWEREALVATRMMGEADGTFTLYPGSSLGLAEIGEVRGPGLLSTDLRPGDRLTVEVVG
jgi:S-adenosylmethionine hydrolase